MVAWKHGFAAVVLGPYDAATNLDALSTMVGRYGIEVWCWRTQALLYSAVKLVAKIELFGNIVFPAHQTLAQV